MEDYGHLTREELISHLRELKAAMGGDGVPAGERPEEFAVFSHWHRREFDRSPWPMRIFEHGTFRFLAVNDAAVKLYGYSREEFLQLTARDTRHPDEHGEFLTTLNEPTEYLRHRGARRHIRKDGKIIVVEAVTQDILFDGVKARLSMNIDVTERDRMQSLLRQREQEFESLTENLPDLVARYDRSRRFRYVNSALEKILGLDRERAIGMSQREVGLSEEIVSLYDKSLAEVFESGQSHKIEFQLELPGGRRFFEACHVPEAGTRDRVDTVLCVARDITERKHAELAMLRSASLTQLLESLARAANEAMSPESAMAACLELICGYGNWVIGRVVLYGQSGPKTVPMQSIWHGSQRERFAEFIRMSEARIPSHSGTFISRVIQEQVPVWLEKLEAVPALGRKAAAIKFGLNSAFAFPIIARGTVVAIIEVFSEQARPQDPLTMGAAQSIASQLARIVEREWAHRANAHMAAIVASSQDAILSRALDGTILTWNPGAERLFGYTAPEILGRNISVLTPPELHQEMFRAQALLHQGQALPANETIRIAKGGRRIHVSTSPSPIWNSRGELWGVSTIIRDITERKAAEQELRDAQQRLQIAVRGGSVGLWDWDLEAGTVYFSPEWKQQIGYEDSEISNRREEWESRLHPEDRARVTTLVKKYLDQLSPDYHAEFRLRHKDGSYRWILSRASIQLGENGKVVRMFGCHVDITEQKQAEGERLANAVSQRDALVREVHHRIKNNLQGVVGLLRQKMSRSPALAADFEETIGQLQSVALIYGLQETRADGLLSLASIMEAICSSAESLIGGRVERTFERKSLGSTCVTSAEAVSVAVALNELVFNALKHQPAEAGKKRACVALSETRGVAEVRITNRGSLPKNFDFMAGRGVRNGLGLVRTLLASPGGSITFNGKRHEVEVLLRLTPPLLADRKQASARRMENGSATHESSAAAHSGSGRRPARVGSAG